MRVQCVEIRKPRKTLESLTCGDMFIMQFPGSHVYMITENGVIDLETGIKHSHDPLLQVIPVKGTLHYERD